MAWYYGTYSCGHEGRTNVIGPTKNRQWIADKRFEDLCPECKEQFILEEREKKNKKAMELAEKMELPSLEGTEKQVAWANTLRQKFIEKMEKIDKEELKWEVKNYILEEFRKVYKEKGEEYARKVFCLEGIEKTKLYILENYKSAVFYIDNRHKRVTDILLKHMEEVFKTDEEKVEEQIIEEIKKESIVIPKNAISNVPAEITALEDKVTVKYDKDYKFIDIVKELGYKWSGTVWERNITNFNGPAEDRAAELGNVLLNNGFTISILDKNIRQMAIDGTFKQEQKKWIALRTKGEYKNWFSISWGKYDNDLYQSARSLPGSKWDKPSIMVRLEHYIEVEEFARLYDFKLSPGAIKAIEEYKKQLKEIEKVTPIEIEKEESKDGLEEILKSNADILDDLKED